MEKMLANKQQTFHRVYFHTFLKDDRGILKEGMIVQRTHSAQWFVEEGLTGHFLPTQSSTF